MIFVVKLSCQSRVSSPRSWRWRFDVAKDAWRDEALVLMSNIQSVSPALKNGVEHGGSSEVAWKSSVADANLGQGQQATALHAHAVGARRTSGGRAQQRLRDVCPWLFLTFSQRP